MEECQQFCFFRSHHASATKRSNVANLSDSKLSPEHHKFLRLGLYFCPTPKFADHVKICHDNEQFCRRQRLHKYFLSNGDTNKSPVHNHRCKTCWTHKLSHLISTKTYRHDRWKHNQHNTADRQSYQPKHKAPIQTYFIFERDTYRTYFWICLFQSPIYAA